MLNRPCIRLVHSHGRIQASILYILNLSHFSLIIFISSLCIFGVSINQHKCLRCVKSIYQRLALVCKRRTCPKTLAQFNLTATWHEILFQLKMQTRCFAVSFMVGFLIWQTKPLLAGHIIPTCKVNVLQAALVNPNLGLKSGGLYPVWSRVWVSQVVVFFFFTTWINLHSLGEDGEKYNQATGLQGPGGCWIA